MPYTEALAKLTDIVSSLSLKVSDTFALLRKAGQGAIVDIALHNNDHEAHAADKVTDASVRNFSSADLLVTPRALGLAFNAKYNAANGLDEDLNDYITMQHFGQHLFMAAGTPQNSPYGGKIIVDISGCFDNRDRLCVKQTVYPVSGQNQETAQYFVRYYQPTSDPQFTPWIDMSRARWAGTGPAVNGWTKLPNGLIIAYGTLRMETGTTLNKWVPPVKLPDSSVFNLTYRSSVPRKISGAWVDGGLNVYLEAPEPQAVNISISAIGF